MTRPGPNQVYLVAGSKNWCRSAFDRDIRTLAGSWQFVGTREQLTPELLRTLSPRYIFFLHWSWKVPKDVIERYECVCFHMTDLPYGRGGSPLQNLISEGRQHTVLTAFRMTQETDAGPVYAKTPFGLGGGAEEIYIRAMKVAAGMIASIIREQPTPTPQSGPVVHFRRRVPLESAVPTAPTLLALFDFIRMLDAEGYPAAFLEHNGFLFRLRRPALYDRKIIAEVEITKLEEDVS